MLTRELNFDNLQTDHRYIKCRETAAYQITTLTRFARPTGYLAPRARITAERKNGGIFRSLRWPESQRETETQRASYLKRLFWAHMVL